MDAVFYNHKEVVFVDFFDCGNPVLLSVNLLKPTGYVMHQQV
jgi:hypothetical protein